MHMTINSYRWIELRLCLVPENMSSLHLNPIFRGGNTSHTDCLYCALSSSIVSSGYSEKKPAEYCKTPLLPPDLEASVINFIPKGEWLYIATVCKRWREIYLQKCRCANILNFRSYSEPTVVVQSIVCCALPLYRFALLHCTHLWLYPGALDLVIFIWTKTLVLYPVPWLPWIG